MAVTETKRRTRTGGRAGAARRRGTDVIEQMPWNPPTNIDAPTEPLTGEGIEAMNETFRSVGFEDSFLRQTKM